MTQGNPIYFIAEIGGNHEGSLNRAIDLIKLAAESGATAVKFQHYTPEDLVNSDAISRIPPEFSPHKKSGNEVLQILSKLSVPLEWTEKIFSTCQKFNVEFVTAPYDLKSIERLVDFVSCFKVGSGDLNWHEKLKILRNTNKHIILSTGAATFDEVEKAMQTLDGYHDNVSLLQCNSNYDSDLSAMSLTHLNVLQTYKKRWPKIKIGLSDHQKPLAPVLGAVANGATVIERHFSDDPSRVGADHRVALGPIEWSNMVRECNYLISAMGSYKKELQPNEKGTRITQRRGLWASKNLSKGHVIDRSDLLVLRPALPGTISPESINKLIGKRLLIDMKKLEAFNFQNIDEEGS